MFGNRPGELCHRVIDKCLPGPLAAILHVGPDRDPLSVDVGGKGYVTNIDVGNRAILPDHRMKTAAGVVVLRGDLTRIVDVGGVTLLLPRDKVQRDQQKAAGPRRQSTEREDWDSRKCQRPSPKCTDRHDWCLKSLARYRLLSLATIPPQFGCW